MVSKKAISEIMEENNFDSPSAYAILTSLFNRDLDPDIRVLLEFNTLLLDCKDEKITSNPNFKRYMELQRRFTLFYSEFVKPKLSTS